MKKYLALLLLLVSPLLRAQNGALSGDCKLGATKASVMNIGSTNYLQGVIPSCTVTVYQTGTPTLATIYSNAGGTALSNPFTASTAGAWIFYAAANQGYDVVLSGGTPPNTYPSPVTITDLFIGQSAVGAFLPLSGGTVGGITYLPLGKISLRSSTCGAYGDFATQTPTATIGAGSSALTASAAVFTAQNVGETVVVPGAGASGYALITTITGFTSTTVVTLATPATTAVSGKMFGMGHDDSAAIQTCINYGYSHFINVYAPSGSYLVTQPLNASTTTGILGIYGDGTGFSTSGGRTNATTFIDALTSAKVVMDFGGDSGGFVKDFSLTPFLGNLFNSQSSGSILVSNGATGNIQAGGNFFIDNVRAIGGTRAGDVACMIVGADLITVRDSNCYSYGAGGIFGWTQGGSTVSSAFYPTIVASSNPTSMTLKNSLFSGSLAPGLELTGSQDYYASNLYVPAVGAGMAAGTGRQIELYPVTGLGGVPADNLHFINVRTETQTTAAQASQCSTIPTPQGCGYTPLMFGNRSDGGIITGSLCSDPASPGTIGTEGSSGTFNISNYSTIELSCGSGGPLFNISSSSTWNLFNVHFFLSGYSSMGTIPSNSSFYSSSFALDSNSSLTSSAVLAAIPVKQNVWVSKANNDWKYSNQQGSDTNLLTSGTVSGAAGTVLCIDANGGATTSCPAIPTTAGNNNWTGTNTFQAQTLAYGLRVNLTPLSGAGGTYSVLPTDYEIEVLNGSTGAYTLNLPTSAYSGKMVIIVQTSTTYPVTISGNGNLISGHSTLTIPPISGGQNSTVVKLIADGNNWMRQTDQAAGTGSDAQGTFTAGDCINVSDSAGHYKDSGSPCTSQANVQVTIGTTAIAANSCSSVFTQAMTGVTTSSSFFFTPTGDVSGITGWGPQATGKLYFSYWPTAGILNYKVCNGTAASITPSASTTWNVGAR